MNVRHAIALALLSACPVLGTARAEGVWTLVVENDVFYGSDRDYTNGVAFAWAPPPLAPAPEWAQAVARWAPLFPEGGRIRYGYVIGQTMSTPADISVREPLVTDRPYAGWLYGTVALNAEGDGRFDQLALSAGVIGPASLADRAQIRFHRLTGSRKPEGWASQLRNEPGVLATWQRSWRRLWSARVAGLEVDGTPHLGAALGNVYTYANAGYTVRLGQRLARDFGTLRIAPAPPGAGFTVPGEGASWYAFVGIDGRAVGRNVFLDGNTFRSGPGVLREPWVGDLHWGFAITRQSVRLGYTHVRRTREFRGQAKSENFGAASISVSF